MNEAPARLQPAELGRQPLTLPSPLDELLLEFVRTRRGKASLGHTDDHNWLFPGGLPGQAMHPESMAGRLRQLGVSSRIGHNTALWENADLSRWSHPRGLTIHHQARN